MLKDVQELVRNASHKIGIGEDSLQILLEADSEHIFDIKLKSGKSYKAYRVQHNNKSGPYKGGIRYHKNVSLNEVRALAILMSLKTAALDLPMGGGKGGVAVNPREISKDELEELSRKYVRHLAQHIGPDKDVPAPDVNTNSMVIDWMVDEYNKAAGKDGKTSFTGKGLGNGGSQGRVAATGSGGVVVLREALKQAGKEKTSIRYAVQGFGNVGYYFAAAAQAEHTSWSLIGVADSSCVLYSKKGLDPKELGDFKQTGSHFDSFKKPGVDILDSEDFVKLDVDVLVLAALEDAVNSQNMKFIKAKYIVEMANGPVTSSAHKYLTNKGTVVLPDIIANGGGVVVSYLEWLQNKKSEHWSEVKVNEQLEQYMTHAVKKMYSVSKDKNVSLKEAAAIIALENLI